MSELAEHWLPRLDALADALRSATRDALLAARRDGTASALAEPAAQGVGDVTYGLDLPSEAELTRWLERCAREASLSLLTEDAGWRHRGPAPGGGTRELSGFDHGGPRLCVDPVDGTRNLMAGLRSAWSVLALAGPGAGPPRLSEVELGVVGEIPGPYQTVARRLRARAGGPCTLEERPLADGEASERRLEADGDDRVDHGYFPFFRYAPRERPALARLEAAFFERLDRHEGADTTRCYDDQYISNAGQLVLLALGTYRCIFDARPLAAEWCPGGPRVTSKPYDLAGAVVCARAAGCEVTDLAGAPLDFELDATTPVGFAGYANAATRARLEPHWLAAVETARPASAADASSSGSRRARP